ncbi:hypothetical protein [Glycomyces buryatensis]|uniref:Uncharacterized protein n=1 Tax=Glycomyces buryatensis TaxID=2570927 RepID=A0A4S8QCP1_9ACTN|nr:hypothetical protein [Glycomyces buryatensis]THV40782.1 hypothetical protein FAB82_14115 [Glycomyces buryatensis]
MTLLFTLAVGIALWFAFRAKRVEARAAYWGLAAVAWLAGLFTWDISGTVLDYAKYLLLALLPIAFVAMSWRAARTTRPRADIYTAEPLLLVLGFLVLWLVAFNTAMSKDGSNSEVTWYYLASYLVAAAAFIAAAVMRKDRRIGYGAAALACVLLVALYKQVLWTETPYFGDQTVLTSDQLFALLFLGIPVLGIIGQLVWWILHARRAWTGR